MHKITTAGGSAHASRTGPAAVPRFTADDAAGLPPKLQLELQLLQQQLDAWKK
jgi:hypothetical protein